VSDLPTELVAAFRATLEEVLEADILLHVRDVSHTDSEAQKRDVELVLAGLFGKTMQPANVIEACNKADMLDDERKAALRDKGALVISALDGEGVDTLLQRIETEILQRFFTPVSYTLKLEDGKAMAWLYAHGKVMEQTQGDAHVHVVVQLSADNIRRFEQMQHVEIH
jgi:GTP-binding protein HflX